MELEVLKWQGSPKVYALVSTVNPDGLVIELDHANNILITYIEIRDRTVTILEREWDASHEPRGNP